MTKARFHEKTSFINEGKKRLQCPNENCGRYLTTFHRTQLGQTVYKTCPNCSTEWSINLEEYVDPKDNKKRIRVLFNDLVVLVSPSAPPDDDETVTDS
jgi:hypothetical protein